MGFQYQPDPVAGTTQVSFWEFAAEGGPLSRSLEAFDEVSTSFGGWTRSSLASASTTPQGHAY